MAPFGRTLPDGVLVPAALSIGPAWSAKFNHGVHGTFTAEYCEKGKAGCYWQGSFVSSDGTDRRDDVGMDADKAITAVGQQVPAIDTGDYADVYPSGGGSEWILTTVFFLGALAALGFWAVRIPVPAVRQAVAARRARRG